MADTTCDALVNPVGMVTSRASRTGIKSEAFISVLLIFSRTFNVMGISFRLIVGIIFLALGLFPAILSNCKITNGGRSQCDRKKERIEER
ncbi:MAG: hypothetical protein JRN35_06170 [Nitrososphaerota archaeon]|nr:hypothetical protein [Nitrososphaerota archaeon]